MDTALSSPGSSRGSLEISEAPTPELDISDLPELVPDVPTNVSLPTHRRRLPNRSMRVTVKVVGSSTTKVRADRASLTITICKLSQDRSAAANEALEATSKFETFLGEISPNDAKSVAGSSSRASSSENIPSLSWRTLPLSTHAYTPEAKSFLGRPSSPIDEDQIQKFVATTSIIVSFAPSPDFFAISALCAELSKDQDVWFSEISWSLADSTRARHISQIRIEAMQDAKSQAQDYARALGSGGVLRPLEISSDSNHPGSQNSPNVLSSIIGNLPPPPPQGIQASTREVARQRQCVASRFEPPELVLTCSVQVKYEVGFD